MTRFVLSLFLVQQIIAISSAQDPYPWRHDVRWTKTKWTANEEPYERITKSIAERYGGRSDTTALEVRLKTLRGFSKLTPLEAFERLSLDVMRTRKKRMLTADVDFDKSIGIAAKYGDFTSYSMVRMRFLGEARHFYGKALAPLGERLLEKKLDDYDVERVQAILLRYQFRDDLASQKRSLELTKRIYLRNSSNAGAIGAYGEGAYYLWRLEKTKANANLALEYASKYLKHPDAKPIFVSSLRDYIKEIKAWQGS